MKLRIIAATAIFGLLFATGACTAKRQSISGSVSSIRSSQGTSSAVLSSMTTSAIPAPAASDIQGLQAFLGTGMSTSPGRLGSCPYILVADSRIYLIQSLASDAWASSHPQTPAVGTFEWWNAVGDPKQENPAYLSDDRLKLYLLDTWEQTGEGNGKYITYSYLCDGLLRVGGKQWALGPPPSNSIYQFSYIHATGESSSAAFSGNDPGAFQLILLWRYDSSSVKGYVDDTPLGTLPSGIALHTLKGINPDGAVCVDAGSAWFLLISTAWYNAYLQSIGLDDLISSAS